MNKPGTQLSTALDTNTRIGNALKMRLGIANQRLNDALQKVATSQANSAAAIPANPLTAWLDYVTDLTQRSVLFADTLRQRGNIYVEHTKAGRPPVLQFDYEMVLDGRTFERPVNYALVCITPPAGVKVDNKRRPYIIIDPRAGHGPGIGGFKEDSEIGVALRDGHPTYFVMFFPEPVPGQTLLDVTAAESEFVRHVRETHSSSPKPAIIGNCQGGWAAMMVATSDPDQTGPVVIVGAPMSYWGGAWSEGEGDNPMRYSGGMLGGTWLASLTSDLGNGRFDGAYLVQNFESLNPANTFWDKYYNVFKNVDTEGPRFLEFERWWGGFFLMNREEIEWIVDNLFVGNKLWKGGTKGLDGHAFDLREIKSPIILFASMGDNITPPQQAFNWVADVYESTEDIKSRGQVIVGMMHQDVGHLGIFVSGKVATKEHAQIVSVMHSIENLPPGLWGMQITETKKPGAKPGDKNAVDYDVHFVEMRLEDVAQRLNRAGRVDEKPFEVVKVVSDINQRLYEMFGRPLVQQFANESTAEFARQTHPARVERWAWSDRNPLMPWLGSLAETVRANRKPLGSDNPLRQAEARASSLISASLDYYRDLRDAFTESAFFGLYANAYVASGSALGDQDEERQAKQAQKAIVDEALHTLNEGGYGAAVARAACLVGRNGQPLPLERLEAIKALTQELGDLLPEAGTNASRRIRGVQEIICRHEPGLAIASLPKLLTQASDRRKFLALLDAVEAQAEADPDDAFDLQASQLKMMNEIRRVLGAEPSTQVSLPLKAAKLPAPKKAARAAPVKAAAKALPKASLKAVTKPAAKPAAKVARKRTTKAA